MSNLKRIVLVADSTRDMEMAIQALDAYHLANEFVEAVEPVGAFWAVLNEPPPGGIRRPRGGSA